MMNETIRFAMIISFSVLHFIWESHRKVTSKEILSWADGIGWKTFVLFLIVVKARKENTLLLPQAILNQTVFLLFVGDLSR